MTLARQLILVITLLLLIVFVGTLTSSVMDTRNFLNDQLRSHAQDTATSLGLSLTPVIEANDMPMMNSMVDAINDRGYYGEIVIRTISGEVMLERHQPVWIEGVPTWFIRLLPLETPEGTSMIAIGWKQAATVHVRSHPGYAYRTLWNTATDTALWTLVSGLVAFGLIAVVVHFVLAPLRQLEQQALAISSRKFPRLERLPFTRELRRVAEAMNKMSSKVEGMLSAQSELAEKMRALAFEDEVTGLNNRRGFEERLSHLINAPEEFSFGALYLIELSDFRAYNEEHGYERGDDLLRQTARLIEATCKGGHPFTLARLAGADFAVLLHNVAPDEASGLAGDFGRALTKLQSTEKGNEISGHIGGAYYSGQQSAPELLSAADNALRAAQRKGLNAWHMFTEEGVAESTHGFMEWKSILNRVITGRELTLQFQPVLSPIQREPLHYEVFSRIPSDNANTPLIPAGVFIPMAERHGFAQEIDKVVVEQVISRAAAADNATNRFAINLSSSSVLDREFVGWLCGRLHGARDVAKRLVFEVPEHCILIDLEALHDAVNHIRQCGSEFSLDRFGSNKATFGYLKRLHVDYIKIDGSYIRRIEKNEDSQFLVHTLCEIAHALDIRVIAEYVESEAELDALTKLRVDGVQGHLFGRPR